MAKHIKVSRILFQSRLSIIFEHRTDLIMWLTSGFLSLLFTLSIWKAFRSQDVFHNLWQFYVLVGIISGIVDQRFYYRMSGDIHSGGLSKYLLQPFPYLLRNVCNILASALISTIVNLIALYLVSTQFGVALNLQLSLNQIIAGFPLIILGWGIALMISFLLGCIAFIWIRPGSLYLVFDNLMPFLIGASLPLWMLNPKYQWLIKILPTRWILSGPVEVIFSGTDSFSSVFFSGIIWLIVLSFISRYIWNRVLYLYEAVG